MRLHVCLTLVLVNACSRAPSAANIASGSVSTPSAASVDPVLASNPPPAPRDPVAPSASVAPADSSRVPSVRLENIGMHVGGGPNDPPTKKPIADSVAPHFDELRACWSKVTDATRGGDFGVDLLIPAAGGRAEVSHPRTSLHPDEFRDCVVAVFERIDFLKPRGGKTTVSYALRFSP